MELLYSQPAISFTNATTTITCINTAATFVAYQLPPLQNIWTPSQMVGKGLMIMFGGGYNDVAGAASNALKLQFDVTVGSSLATSTVLAATGLCTVPTTNLGQWNAQIWLNCVSASGTVSTWYSNGEITYGIGNTESGNQPGTAVTFNYMWCGTAITTGVPAAITIPTNVAFSPSLYSTWSAASTMCTTQMMVFGLN